MVTSPGSISVASRTPKKKFRSGKRKYAKAKPTSALANVVSAAPRQLIQMLFHIQRATGATLKSFCGAGLGIASPLKFQDQCCGRNALPKAPPRGLTPPAESHSNG